MTLRCWAGIHRWTYKDERDGDHYDTYARCRRQGCTRYPRWSIVNRDPVEVREERDSSRRAA